MAGMSLSDYLLREIRKSADRPTLEELLDRLKRRTAPPLRESPAAAVRAERESR
jgi:antitoxin FitA